MSQSLAESADRFFGRLVKLVPNELYQHSKSLGGYVQEKNDEKDTKDDDESGEEVDDDEDDDEEEQEESGNDEGVMWNRHCRLPLTAEQRKTKSQEAIKNKYSSAAATVEPVVDGAEMDIVSAPEDSDADSDAESESEKEEKTPVVEKKSEEKDLGDLRRQLQERIMAMKEQRVSKKAADKAARREKAAKKAEAAEKAKKPSGPAPIELDSDEEALLGKMQSSTTQQEVADDSDYDSDYDAALAAMQAREKSGSGEELVGDFDFSQMVDDASARDRSQTSKKYGGKKNRLLAMLNEAEKKRKRLKTFTNSGDEILQKKAKAEQWNDALAVAAGGKAIVVSSNGAPTAAEARIRKALKRREKQKAKSADAWAQRLDAVEDETRQRLAKREENLSNKKHRTTQQKSVLAVQERLNAIGNKGVPQQLRKAGAPTKKASKDGDQSSA